MGVCSPYGQVALSLETYGLTVDAQQMYLDLIGREHNGAGTPHVSQDELETWEVSFQCICQGFPHWKVSGVGQYFLVLETPLFYGR